MFNRRIGLFLNSGEDLMKSSLLSAMSVLLLVASTLLAQDVPDIAEREILRRGDFVERIGDGHRADGPSLFAEAMRPPADDSHKWFISVVSMRACRYCDRLKGDFANSEHLRPFVNASDHTQSWAHYNVYQIEDETQKWRWEGIKFGGFPTLLVQPPRNGRFGDPKTVVWQKTGYDGDAKKLADELRKAIAAYAQKFSRQQNEGVGQGLTDQSPGQSQYGQYHQPGDYEPPFTPPPQNDPTPYAPSPLQIPPLPTPVPSPTPVPVPSPAPNPVSPFSSLLTLFLSLLGGLLTSGGLTNLLLLGLAVLAIIRTYRKAMGYKLLLDDETYQKVVDAVKDVLQPAAEEESATNARTPRRR